MARITRTQASKLLGKRIFAVRKDGTVASGKLVKILGNQLILEQRKGKKVQTKAIIPLVLFDLLAIGTFDGGFGYGGFGGFGGYGGFGGFGGGFGGWW